VNAITDIWVPLKDNKIVRKLNDYQLLQKTPYYMKFVSYLLRCLIISLLWPAEFWVRH